MLADITSAFGEWVRSTGSVFGDSPALYDELLARASEIIDETATSLGLPTGAAAGAHADVDVGRDRAEQLISPAQSLAAASALFDIALPYLLADQVTGHLSPEDVRQGLVARTLHQAIMRRVLPSALSYVDVLLGRVELANSLERTRIAGDLHDRMAHGIASAIQQLELHRLEAGAPTADPRIAGALDILRDTLEGVRDLAGSMRDRVGERSLDAALVDFLSDAQTESLDVRVTVVGDTSGLPSYLKEEAFLITREALRNALSHGVDTSTVELAISVGHRTLSVRVSDDGGGFRRDAARPSSMGLATMEDRARALGGAVSIAATMVGTDVVLEIPVRR